MKTNYYLDGKLVRTSKSDRLNYNFVVVIDGKLTYFTSKIELAQKEIARMRREYDKGWRGYRCVSPESKIEIKELTKEVA